MSARPTLTPDSPVPRGERDFAAESMFEYGARVEFWRLMRLFEERGLPMTVFGWALTPERNPPAAIRRAGHDVCCVLPWLALGGALRALRGRGTRARGQGRGLARAHCG
jgi:hypothetical protein